MEERDSAGSWELIDEDGAAGPSPGAQLRAAREARGLTVEAVAEDLHMNTAQIRALEDDDHTSFPAPIFVSGYVRSYARLLKLDPDPLLAALRPRETTAAPSLARTDLATGVRMAAPGVRPVLWIALLLAVAVVAAALVWMGTRGPAVPDAGRGSADALDAAGPPQEEPGDFDAATLEDAQARMQAQAEQEEAPPAAPAAAPRRVDELVLRFRGRSWVEISDATSRRLAVRMGEEGEELRLQGEAPFDILLGNAPNVTLEYNGSPYTDFRASRQNVANFRLGRPNEE